MAEKLLIITEKPSAAKAFSKALGGMSGTFEGDQYTIVNLYGHIIGNPVPDETALPQYAQTVGKFAHLDGIPWQYTWFDFNKKVPSKSMADTAHRVMSNIQGFLQNGYIPVIASDIDPSGEGDLLVREVLIALNYKGKTYREYHVDETPKGIKKALSDLKVVTEDDPTFRMAFTRSNMDYLTQQLTRVATMTIQNKGYKLPAPVPVGRLKSVILTVIGDQLNAIKNYKSPFPSAGAYLRCVTDKLANVNVEHRSRHSGSSGYSFRRLVSQSMNSLTNFSMVPLRAASFLGVLTAMIGFVFGIVTIVRKIIHPEMIAGYASTIAILLFIGGVIMLILGLIGEYIGRIYISLNNSPQFVIREKYNLPDADSK